MNTFSKTIVLTLTILVIGVAGVVSSQTTTPETITEDNLLAEEVVDSATTTETLSDPVIEDVPEENATTSEVISNTESSGETQAIELVVDKVVDPFATNTAPYVSMTSPLGEKTVSGVITISAQASDKETGVAGVQFLLDGKELGQPLFKEPYVIQGWYSTGTPNGVHTLTARAYDEEGKTTESTVTVTFANEEVDIKLAPELPTEPTLILQASGGPASKVKAGSIEANVTIENVTSCKQCKSASPEASVLVYVTPWYPNDGIDDAKANLKYSEKSISVPVLKRGGKYVVLWSGSITNPGKYYFVAVVDPDNILGAKRITRSVFEVQ